MNRYVEYCVPQFKEDRYGDQVRIAGVMSPYLDLSYIDNPSDIFFKIIPIIYLKTSVIGGKM